MLYTVKIYMAQGGRSARNQFSNRFTIDSENALGSPALDVEVDQLVTFIKNIVLDNVFLMRVVVSTYAKEGRAGHPEAVRTRELAGQGSRPIPANTDFLPIDIALALKVSGATGRAGIMKVRGALHEGDVSGNASGAFNYNPSDTVVLNRLLDFNIEANRPKLVIPFAGSADGEPSRLVTNVAVSGVVIQKHQIKRKKTAATTHNTFLPHLDTVLALASGIATYLRAGAQGVTGIEKAAAVTKAAGAGEVIGTIIEALPGIIAAL